MVDKCPQRIHPRYQYIDSQVKLQFIYQVRLVQVSLSDIVLTCLQPFKVSGQENTLALATGFGLHNEGLRFLIIKLGFKILSILGKKPSFREKVEIRWACLFDSHQIFSEKVFPGKSIHSWEVIRSLVELHFKKECRSNWSIYPIDVPILLFIIAQYEVQLITDVFKNFILRVHYINH